MGKTSSKVKNRYNLKTYDRINTITPKGGKDRIKAAADAAGQSVNAYILQAIAERMQREGVQPPAAEEEE